MVNEDGSSIKKSQSRTPDDFQVFNETCEDLNVPNRFCQGRDFAYQRSPLRPPCADNNSSINALSGCIASNGTALEKCVSVAYTSNTFIPQCGKNDDGHCGTYLEIHKQHGTPYSSEGMSLAITPPHCH